MSNQAEGKNSFFAPYNAHLYFSLKPTHFSELILCVLWQRLHLLPSILAFVKVLVESPSLVFTPELARSFRTKFTSWSVREHWEKVIALYLLSIGARARTALHAFSCSPAGTSSKIRSGGWFCLALGRGWLLMSVTALGANLK